MLAQSIKAAPDLVYIENRRWLFLLILMLMSTAGLVGSDVYLPSLPEMGNVFQRSPHDMQLTLGIYLFGLSVGQLILGPLTDRYGRKNLLILGMLVYCAASLSCLYTHSYYQILILRFIQAIGACSGLIIGRAIVGDLFDAKEAGKIFSTIFPIVGMSPAISPVIGGFLAYYYGWQSTFVFVALFALCVGMLVIKYMPETHCSHKRASLDIIKIISTYPKVFFNPKFITYVTAPCAAYFAYFAYIAQSPFIFYAHGYSERAIGTFYITLSLAYVAGNILGRRLLSFFELDRLMGLGYLLFNMGAALLFASGLENMPLLMMVISVSILAFGNGLLIPLGTAGVISSFPGNVGYASGMLGFLQLGSAALSAAIVSTLTQNSILYLGVYMLFVTLTGTIIFYFFKKIMGVNSSLVNSTIIPNFFVISLEYLVQISTVERHLLAHCEFLDRGYHDGIFIASGRKVPRSGGVIFALAESKKSLEELINCDPFKIYGVAEYSITEFEASRYNNALADLVESSVLKNKIEKSPLVSC